MVSGPSTGRTTATENLQELVLPQSSVATTTTTLVVFGRNELPDGGVEVTETRPQVSEAVAAQVTTTALVPQVLTTMLLGQTSVGGVVSCTRTSCVQMLLFVQQSSANQVRRMTCGHVPLVTVPNTVRVTLEPQQASTAVGVPKVQEVPHSTIWSGGQMMTGGTVSLTVTTCVQTFVLSQQSTTNQVKAIVWLHVGPLVTAL